MRAVCRLTDDDKCTLSTTKRELPMHVRRNLGKVTA
jgi:hypothetical protein